MGLTVSETSVTVTASDTGTGTITNDDGQRSGDGGRCVSRRGDALSFTVTLDKAVAGGLKVTPDFTDETATEGTDYTENTSVLTFTGTAGETKTFTVSTTEDTVVETNETFTVGLTVSGTSVTVTATDTATGTITNDDSSAAVTVNDASASEGDALSFTVTLDKAVAGGLEGDAGLHRRHGDGGHRLHGEHGGADVHGDGWARPRRSRYRRPRTRWWRRTRRSRWD